MEVKIRKVKFDDSYDKCESLEEVMYDTPLASFEEYNGKYLVMNDKIEIT